MANVIASVAQYDNEVRSERVLAGQAVARAAGKKWGGSRAGERSKVTPAQRQIIKNSNTKGISITLIASAMKLSRPTVYKVLKEMEDA
jgi:DNA invertase Pin-like site-specific DNA recombinase